MKSMKNVTLLNLAMGSLLAICFNAGFANAQTVAGKFTLPFEAHWGQATLPAGDYSFRLESGTGGTVLVSRGTKNVAYIMEQGYSIGPSDGMSLTVVRNSAGNTVSALNLPGIGKVLHYVPSKPVRTPAAKEREIAQLIPITVGK